MNKSDISNILAFLIMAFGYSSQNDIFFSIGIFALSGSITNTLAIHMLFEKVPYLYGSGVIENRFTQFKESIHTLIMNQFFTKDNLNRFFQDELSSVKKTINFEEVLNKADFSPAYTSLKDAVMESSFGGMLGMFGGETALEPLKEPFTNKLKKSIILITQTKSFQETLKNALSSKDLSDDIYFKLSLIVNQRLDELSPKMVKVLIQDIIRKHLGWLVVWGAIFGGLIGLLSTLLV